MSYIFYHANSSVTGRELKRVLGIDGGTEGPDRRPDKIIRWGNRAELRFQASVQGGVLNKKNALTDASNKGRCLELLSNAGINTPPAATRFDGELLVGRTETHVGGSGFFLISSQRDFELAQQHLHCTHFMTYIPTQREYRVHVFKGRVIGVGEKLMGENCTSLHIRNVGTGWTFRYNNDRMPQDIQDIGVQAVQALGLDFGAVDILKSTGNNFYVLEVNTAPSLCKPTEGGARREVDHGPVFNMYVEAFRNWLTTGR
jgi:glutathione synthase/RimK-type ligase-like ATP-grasp enzyme